MNATRSPGWRIRDLLSATSSGYGCDATAGFVGYKREVLAAIDFDRIEMVGYGFQIEMKYTAWKMGFRIGEVPIIFADRTEGTS